MFDQPVNVDQRGIYHGSISPESGPGSGLEAFAEILELCFYLGCILRAHAN